VTALLSEFNLDDDLKEVLGLPEVKRWELVRKNPLEILATMSPATAPREQFEARLIWGQYPDEPPSLKFRDPKTGRLDEPAAWPKVRGFRPQQLDACVNYCTEGFALHPEWKTDPKLRWDPRGNVLLKVLRTLQSELDDHYQGRYP
jgi:hypothetical protein